MSLFVTIITMLLGISANGRYLQTSDGEPFFLLGNSTWLMPERLTREEVDIVLRSGHAEGYNFAMVKVVDDLPATNAYGFMSGNEAYWEHLDYIVDKAAEEETYVGMVCMWGSMVKMGKVDENLASDYGKFLANRYRDKDNIIWVLGGDIRGDVAAPVWDSLAFSIKSLDDRHLMTYLPYGRTSSITWWNDSDWLDFNMFHSGHRAYDQLRGDGSLAKIDIAEDNWLFVEEAWDTDPARPILDGEPCFEEMPHGMYDVSQPRWKEADVRRYAYWSVFSGACGHVYGHNSIIQFYNGEAETAEYGAKTVWTEALRSPGFRQMKYLKALMESFPYFERVPDQNILLNNGERYERAVATRGDDYMLIYTYTNSPMEIDLTRISGNAKKAFWYDVTDGSVVEAGRLTGGSATMQFIGDTGPGNDHVLIVVDARSKRLPAFLGGGSSITGRTGRIKSLFKTKNQIQ